MEIEEIEVAAPWGTIAIKAWGDKQNFPILCVHGWMDNAGSFDGLLNLLPSCFYYIVVDLPGHGFSTKFPSPVPISSIDNVLVYMIVMDYFKKDKFIVMGHSWGGQLGFLFTQMYPEKVEKLIILDSALLMPLPSSNTFELIANGLDTFIEIDKRGRTTHPPVYTYDEAVKKLTVGRKLPLTENAAKALLERMLLPVGENQFRLNFDQKLKVFINPLQDYKDSIETLKSNPVLCPVLIVRAKLHFNIYKPFDQYFKTLKNFTTKYVEGTHDVHNNEPEKVAPFVKEFLLQHKSKL